MKTNSLMVAAIVWKCIAMVSNAQENGVPAPEPAYLAEFTTGETNALVGAINKFRADLGLPALAVDPDLTARAAAAFPALASVPGEVDVTALRKEFSATKVSILRGVITHRGEKSGAGFPKYWAKEPQWNVLMTGDFTHIGAATAKRSDGKLVAFAYLIRR